MEKKTKLARIGTSRWAADASDCDFFPSFTIKVAAAAHSQRSHTPRPRQLARRGSFLSRGKEALARLVTTARSLSVPGGASSRNSSNRTFSVARRATEAAESEPLPDLEVEHEFRQTVEAKVGSARRSRLR